MRPVANTYIVQSEHMAGGQVTANTIYTLYAVDMCRTGNSTYSQFGHLQGRQERMHSTKKARVGTKIITRTKLF